MRCAWPTFGASDFNRLGAIWNPVVVVVGASVVVLQHVDAPLPPPLLSRIEVVRSPVPSFLPSFGPWQDHNSIIIG